MKNYTASKRLFAVAFALLVIASCCVGISFSKYVTNQPAHWTNDGKDEDYLDFTVNSVFVVSSQDALFEAINQGYTYVQLDKEIENPLIVTQKAENLTHDLILDLNGIEIQRNGPDPILNVKDNVRLTVVDTSTEQTGGLYNPVGSVFSIAGGTLTVVTGAFESGPRYSEYYSYNTDVLKNQGTTRRTVVEENEEEVVFQKRDNNSFVSVDGVTTAPIIKSYPTRTGEVTYTHGNLYFDEQVTRGDLTIQPDTYCYYRTSENAGNTTDVSMADWYYSYFVNKSDYSYAYATLPTTLDEGKTKDDYVEITIYGYEDVIKEASKINTPSNYYAAIQMQKGTLDVQDGQFFQYFGLSNTACVNSAGGEITVKQGKFSCRIPDATTFSSNTVTIKEADKTAFEDAYFSNFKWNSSSGNYNITETESSATHNGRLAKSGESYCILNHGDAKVTIGTCDLYSSNNNIISMQGGSLTIGGGSFTKKMLVSLPDTQKVKKSAIYVNNGTLDVFNTTCTVTGEGTRGIDMDNGTLTINSATFDITGDNSCGINISSGSLSVDKSTFEVKANSGGGTVGIYSTISSGTFTVKDTDFSISGTNANGIYSKNGNVRVEATGLQTIQVNGANAIGINVDDGGSVVSNGYLYDIDGNSSIGIYASNGAQGITIDGGAITVNGDSTHGIKSLISGDDKFTVNNFDITMTGGESQTGIYSENGTVKVVADASNTISIDGEKGCGIHVATGGSVVSQNYSYDIQGKQSYGIKADAGNVTLSNGDITLASGESCYGVYAVSTEKLSIDITNAKINVGTSDTTEKSGITTAASIGVFLSSTNNSSTVALTKVNISSLEVGVAVNGGSLTIYGTGEIKTQKASAIAIRGGNLTFDANSNYTLTSANTTTDDYKNTYDLTIPVYNESGKLDNTDYRNTDGIYVNGGSFTSNGTLSVTHTGLRNQTFTTSECTYYKQVVNSYVVRVLGGNVTIKKGTFIANAGGGIYSGTSTIDTTVGSIVLGDESSKKDDIIVETNGVLVTAEEYHALGVSVSDQWKNYQSITGGHAVEINGGNITVYNGSYTAQFGNGILANGSGDVTVHDGEFIGNMNANGSAMAKKSGPSAYYGLKVVGGAKVTIKGGTFDGGNGGAFVTGVTEVSGRTIENSSTAQVFVYAGIFGHGDGDTETSSVDAFNVYDDAQVVIGAGGSNYFSTKEEFQNAIVMRCWSAPIAANRITNGTDYKQSIINVYYGTYYGKTFYNDKSVAVYTTYNTNDSIAYTVCKYTGTDSGSFSIAGEDTTAGLTFYGGN